MFTDRVEEQRLLRNLLAPEQSASLRTKVLLTQFYGVGGVGKSTLCQRACEIAAAEFKATVRVVATSFDDSRWKDFQDRREKPAVAEFRKIIQTEQAKLYIRSSQRNPRDLITLAEETGGGYKNGIPESLSD